MKKLTAAPVLIALLIGLTLAACGGDDTASPAASYPDDGINAELAPNDLLAVLNPDDVKAAFIEPETWWPMLPEFNVGFEPAPEPIEGDRFWVTQSYEQVGALSRGRVETTLILFGDEAAAQAGFAAMRAIDGAARTVTAGPTAGDESRYFTHEATADELDEGALPYETMLRYRVGPLVGRISVFTELGYEQVETLASYFAPIERRAKALLAGDLTAEDLPEAIAALLPAAAASPVGSVFGSAVRLAEAWALVDTSRDPEAVLEALHSSGVARLGLRRYGLEGEPDLVVEATVYQMNTAADAAAWVRQFVQTAEDVGTLDAGATGDLSAYTSYGGEFYELQFAKGPVVGDVVCFAPFGETTAACEEPLRTFAERWYEELPVE